jgi:hypothetical protein
MTDHAGASGPQPPAAGGGGSSGGAPQLPDFSGASSGSVGAAGLGGRPGGPSPDGPDPTGYEGGGGKGPRLAILLGGVGAVVVVLTIVALVLSWTVFRAGPEDPTAGAGTSSPEEEDPTRTRPSEYVPTEEQTDEAGGEITFAEQPTVDCTIHDTVRETEQVEGVVRGGGLEFAHVEGWEVGTDWSGGSAYQVDQHFAHQSLESGWYTVTSVAAVEVPEEEGGYPGAEETARAIFQCGISRDQVEEIYGDPVELKDYRDEAFTVDGHEAWIVSADVQLSELAPFRTTDAWRLVVIVVDTPDGPAVFDGGAATGHAQQVADLETMIGSLRVL